MSASKEKLLIENLISSPDIFLKCRNIIKPEYFEPEYKPVVKFMMDYYQDNTGLPTPKILKAEFDIDFSLTPITQDVFNYTCKEIEKFCKERALTDAIFQSIDDVEKQEYGKVEARIKDALQISLEVDLGLELFNDTEETLKSFLNSVNYEPTGIKPIDDMLDGGIARQQVTLYSANSGGGKSVMLANIGANFAKRGFNVLYISLELSEQMIYLRLASILSGVSARVWKSKIHEMAHSISQTKEYGAGTYTVKRLPNGTTTNGIAAYIKQYELENGMIPDLLLVDYLDEMFPNGGTKNLSISEQDKEKARELYGLVYEYNMFCCTASQQNRDGIRTSSPDMAIIAGGMYKVNVVDNYISLYADPSMKLAGQMIAHALKTRSSDGAGKSTMLKFDTNNLRITAPDNYDGTNNIQVMPSNKIKDLKAIVNNSTPAPVINSEIELPNIRNDKLPVDDYGVMEYNTLNEMPEEMKKSFSKKSDEDGEGDNLIKLFTTLGGINYD